jgi:hypothetical protein
MRTLVIGLLVSLASLVFGATVGLHPSLAADDQAYLRIFADTQVMKMAGMPPLPPMPNIPGLGSMMKKIPGMGGPMRTLQVRLFAPLIAPDNATASLAIPDVLKLGPKLDLELYRPKPEPVKPGEVSPDQTPDFTVLRYWGSSPTVREGQPETFNWGALTDEQKAMLREEMSKSAKKSQYLYKEDWTTGYWPNGKATGMLDDKASLVGHYALTTTFTGNVQLDVPSGVDILGGINLTAPDLTQFPPLDQAMTFNWDPVDGVLGYYATIIGMKGDKTMITWSSSEVKEGAVSAWDYLDENRVAELVEATVFMAPDRQEVTVPAGIFQDCDTAFMMMIGFGRGVAPGQGTPLPSLQTRTTLMVTLGGKKMQEEGDGGA